MIDKELLGILVCPKDRSPLRIADSRLLARVNQAIAAGRVRNMAGGAVAKPIPGGLVRQDGMLLYPILDDIPVMLIDEAILLDKVV